MSAELFTAVPVLLFFNNQNFILDSAEYGTPLSNFNFAENPDLPPEITSELLSYRYKFKTADIVVFSLE